MDDIVLVDEARHKVNVKLEFWRNAYESKSFWLSMTKKIRNKDERLKNLTIKRYQRVTAFDFLDQ